MYFGRNFVRARHKKGVDQKVAAAELGVSAAFLSKVENDKQKPSIDLILKAAEYYNEEPGFFFESKKEIDINSLNTDKNKKFIEDLKTLTSDEIKEKYEINFDGNGISDANLKAIMAYVRTLLTLD